MVRSSISPSAFAASARERIGTYVAGRESAEQKRARPTLDQRIFSDSLGEGDRRRCCLSRAVRSGCIISEARGCSECDLPVPEVYDVSGETGLSSGRFGQQTAGRCSKGFEDDRKPFWAAIKIIARIQAATTTAIERDSIVSRLAFDKPKLM